MPSPWDRNYDPNRSTTRVIDAATIRVRGARTKAEPIVLRVELPEALYLRLSRRVSRDGVSMGAFCRAAIASAVKS